MTETNVKVNEMLANPLVRNVLHLICTIFIGYIVLRLLLYTLDATNIGLGWLEANQGSGFFVMILILILSLLAIDAGISLGRRRLGDVKYSVVESGISLAKASIQKSHELPVKVNEKVKEKSGTGIPHAERPSGGPGGFGRKEPVIKETQIKKPAPVSGLNLKSEPAVKKEEMQPAPVMEPAHPEVKPEPTPSKVSSTAPVQERNKVIPEKPVLPEDVIKNPVPYNNGLADELVYEFPEKVIEYYWEKAYKNIPNGNRKTYRFAAKNLGKAKIIYISILKDETTWIKRFSDLKSEFKNRPAFLDEVKHL